MEGKLDLHIKSGSLDSEDLGQQSAAQFSVTTQKHPLSAFNNWWIYLYTAFKLNNVAEALCNVFRSISFSFLLLGP